MWELPVSLSGLCAAWSRLVPVVHMCVCMYVCMHACVASHFVRPVCLSPWLSAAQCFRTVGPAFRDALMCCSRILFVFTTRSEELSGFLHYEEVSLIPMVCV
jgi:hypothetical protein